MFELSVIVKDSDAELSDRDVFELPGGQGLLPTTICVDKGNPRPASSLSMACQTDASISEELEVEASGEAQIVLKLDYDGRSWKRVRKKIKAAAE